MSPSDNLFRLIKALSTSEKAYFKKFVAQYNDTEFNYLKLFNVIERQKSYDEEKIKRKFKNENFVKHLADEKKHLEHNILRALRAYNANKTKDGMLRSALEDIRILFDKGLTKKCNKKIKNIREKAKAQQNFRVLLELLDWEAKIITQKQLKNKDELLADIQKKENKILEIINTEIRLHRLSNMVYHFMTIDRKNKSKRDKALITNIKSDPMLQSEPGDESFEAKLSYYYTHAYLAQMEGDVNKVFHIYQKIVEWWERNLERIKENTIRYRKALYSYLNSCLQIELYSEFPSVIQKLRKLPAKSEREIALIFSITSYVELLYYINTSQYHKAEEIVPAIESGIDKYGDIIGVKKVLAFYFNIAAMYFVTIKFDDALTWINKILNFPKPESDRDIYQVAKILQIIVHYEKGNIDLIDNLIRATVRNESKWMKLNDYEKAFYQFMQKFPAQVYRRDKQALLNEFLERLQDYKDKLRGKHSVGLEESILWARSKLERIPMINLLQEKNRMKAEAMIKNPANRV